MIVDISQLKGNKKYEEIKKKPRCRDFNSILEGQIAYNRMGKKRRLFLDNFKLKQTTLFSSYPPISRPSWV